MACESGPARGSSPARPMVLARNHEEPDLHAVNHTALRTNPRHRRWKRRRSVTLSDVGLWVTWFILTAAVLLALCLLVTLAWPTP